MTDQLGQGKSRRHFLRGMTASAASIMVLKSSTVFSAQANSAIELGIVGSGGRGQYIGRMMQRHGENKVKVVAVQDPFKDRVDDIGEQFEVEASRRYAGIPSYEDLIASQVDAVAVTSPPYFHPMQVAAAVDAGKHVWLAKPVAVDVPGCKSIAESAKKAEGKFTFLVDFQTRNSQYFKECADRIHKGEIGEPVLGHVYYHAGRLDPKHQPGMSEDEARLRNWVFDIKLSGDIIVEQNIHVLDVGNWYLNTLPLKAFGTCGRKARVDVGDCKDHFIVTYWYPNDVKVDFSSAQFTKGYDDLCIRLYGSKGTADTHYFGRVNITGDNPWEGTGEKTTDTMDVGVTNNVKDFVASIASGKFINTGEYPVTSTLTAILGRMAAYGEKEVTWDEMMKTDEKFEVNLKV